MAILLRHARPGGVRLGQKIGRIIGYGNHTEYLASVFRKGEIDQGPDKEDHALGRFVLIGEGDRNIIGIIVSSQLFSEEGLRAGQYLHGMPPNELNLFTPELMDGSMSVLKVRGIGILEGEGNVTMGVPAIVPTYQDPVVAMEDDLVSSVHSHNGKLHLEYLSELGGTGDRGTHVAVINALTQLERVLPDHASVIDLIRREMEWNARMND